MRGRRIRHWVAGVGMLVVFATGAAAQSTAPATNNRQQKVQRNGAPRAMGRAAHSPATPPFATLTGPMSDSRNEATAAMLPDGTVLVVGGWDIFFDSLNTAEIFDPQSATFQLTGSMAAARFSHTSTVLQNGKVLITGGWDRNPDFIFFQSAEIFDPGTGTFSDAGMMTTPRSDHTATLLNDGTVLILGGTGYSAAQNSFYGLTSAEVYDPQAGTFTAVGSLHYPRRAHTATLLADGRVLVTGGADDCQSTNTAEIYDPATQTFSVTGAMTNSRGMQAAVRLSDGSVLVAGGDAYICDNPSDDTPWADAEVFNVQSSQFGPLIAMTDQHEFASAVALPNGQALVVGGGSWVGELYDAGSGTFANDGYLLDQVSTPTLTVLQDGRVLVAGGSDAPGGELLTIGPPATPCSLAVTFQGDGAGNVLIEPGEIICVASCAPSIPSGTNVSLTPTAGNGSVFTGWTGDCSGTDVCQLVMDSAHAVTATFSSVAFPLTVTVSNPSSGTVVSSPPGINCAGSCVENFMAGTIVVLQANPAAGFQFTGWSGDCSGTGSCVVTMSAARNVTATFGSTFPLMVTGVTPVFGTVGSTPAGISCGGVCASNFVVGTVVMLTANPAPGFTFGGWGGDCSGMGACQVTMNAAHNVSATFTALPLVFPLQISFSGGPGAVIINPVNLGCATTCSIPFPIGTQLTLTPNPPAGGVFMGWGGDCSGIDPCAVTMNAAHNVTAMFQAQTGPPSSVPPGFSFDPPPPPQSVPSGGAAHFLITVGGSTGFSGTVSFACTSGLPPFSSCSFSPPNVSAGGGPLSTTLTITTAPRNLAGLGKGAWFSRGLALALPGLGLVLCGGARRRRRMTAVLLLAGLLALAGMLLGCGGAASGSGAASTSNSGGGTPAGNYAVTVSASSGNQSQSEVVNLIVQ